MTNREILGKKNNNNNKTKTINFSLLFQNGSICKGTKKSSYHPFVRLSISVLTAEVVLSEVSHSLPVKQPKKHSQISKLSY